MIAKSNGCARARGGYRGRAGGITADRSHAGVEIKVGVQSELKVRPGFGTVAMKNVRKTKCAEQDRICRQVQFKVYTTPMQNGRRASTGSRTRRTSQRSPAALSTASAALRTSMPMPSPGRLTSFTSMMSVIQISLGLPSMRPKRARTCVFCCWPAQVRALLRSHVVCRVTLDAANCVRLAKRSDLLMA
jgi:hypothetical protein